MCDIGPISGQKCATPSEVPCPLAGSPAPAARRAPPSPLRLSCPRPWRRCSSDDDGGGGGGGDDAITVWIVEDLPDRVAATQAIVDAFTAESGIEVELTPVAEDQFNQILTSNAAAGDLPDVIGGIPLGAAAHAVGQRAARHRRRGRGHRLPRRRHPQRERARAHLRGDTRSGVPSEAWVQLLVYRKDLFEAAGLDAPETYDDVLAAAEALDSAERRRLRRRQRRRRRLHRADLRGDRSRQRLRAGRRRGRGHLRQRRVRRGAGLLRRARHQTTRSPGAQDVDTTRASYFAGQAAMIIWSSFILDEMAGLRNDAAADLPRVRGRPGLPRQEQRRGHLDPGPVWLGAARPSARSPRGRSPPRRRPTPPRSSSST